MTFWWTTGRDCCCCCRTCCRLLLGWLQRTCYCRCCCCCPRIVWQHRVASAGALFLLGLLLPLLLVPLAACNLYEFQIHFSFCCCSSTKRLRVAAATGRAPQWIISAVDRRVVLPPAPRRSSAVYTDSVPQLLPLLLFIVGFSLRQMKMNTCVRLLPQLLRTHTHTGTHSLSMCSNNNECSQGCTPQKQKPPPNST